MIRTCYNFSMSLFYDTRLLSVLDEFVTDMVDAEIKYKARVDINSVDKKPIATIENYAARIRIIRTGRKLEYIATDLGKYYHAQKEGFTEHEIATMVKCHFMVSKNIARQLLLLPELLATIAKENLNKIQTSA
jgi:hypothetical protein